MRKLKNILIALILGIVTIFSIAGCNADTQKESHDKEDDSQSQVDKSDKEIEEELPEEEELAGSFYTLQEAYDNGWLTRDDLMSIAYYHHKNTMNDGYMFNSDLMGEDFKPIDNFPDSLSKQLELSIRKTRLNSLNAEYSTDEFTLENVGISSYYGSYNGGVAIRMYYAEDGVSTSTCWAVNKTIDDVEFYYSSYTEYFRTLNYSFNNSIMIWKQEI